MAKKTGSTFVVDLGGLKLPSATERTIEAKIRKVVFEELANLDLARNLKIFPRPRSPFPDGSTLGIWWPQGEIRQLLGKRRVR